MNRRTALLLTMLSGGLWPATIAAAQDPLDEPDAPPRRRRPAAGAAKAARRNDALEADSEAPAAPTTEGVPADFPVEAGHAWRTYDIARYTSLPHTADTLPQNALIEWIFRRTGSAPWHGDKIAVLCASRTMLRAYHNPKILKQVDEYVERFVKPTADILSVRVHIVAASDPRWRYDVHSRLVPVAGGPLGQQIWSMKTRDAEFVRARMAIY